MAIKINWYDPEIAIEVKADDDSVVDVLKYFFSDDAEEPANNNDPLDDPKPAQVLRYDALPPAYYSGGGKVQETNEIVVRDDGSFGGSFAKTIKLQKDPMRGKFVDVLVHYDDQDWNHEFTLSRAAAEDLLASLEILLRN